MTPQLRKTTTSVEDSKLYGMITRIVDSTRQTRLQEDFGLSDSEIAEIDNGIYTDPLLGECHANAKTLADELYSYGITPHLIWGCFSTDVDEPADTIQAAEEQGTVHFWVEFPQTQHTNTDDRLICEIAAEPSGGVRVSESLPEHYHYLTGGRIEYDPEIISTTQLRDIEGYEHLLNSELVIR